MIYISRIAWRTVSRTVMHYAFRNGAKKSSKRFTDTLIFFPAFFSDHFIGYCQTERCDNRFENSSLGLLRLCAVVLAAIKANPGKCSSVYKQAIEIRPTARHTSSFRIT